MRIMGLDPSITCTGISLPDGTSWAVKPKAKGDARLMQVADSVRNAVTAGRVDFVVMEGLAGMYKGEAARVTPMVHGALRLELMRLGVPYMLLNPTTLKRFATGSAVADKTAMALAALKRLGAEYGTSDECDAAWLRTAGAFVYGTGHMQRPDGTVVILPQVQVDALKRGVKGVPVEWPVVNGRTPWAAVS